MTRAVVCALGLLAPAGVTGCGSDGGTVDGTVTFDGQPVVNGTVAFVRPDGGVREGAVVTDGRFQVRVPPGAYRVEVNAKKVVGKRKQKGFDGKDEEVELTEELIPEKYNAKSTLTADVKPGANAIPFDLKK